MTFPLKLFCKFTSLEDHNYRGFLELNDLYNSWLQQITQEYNKITFTFDKLSRHS